MKILVFIILFFAFILGAFLALAQRKVVQSSVPLGTDFVGMLIEADGLTWSCSAVATNGYCSQWDPLLDTSVDVAESFGPGMTGIAKGQLPLLEGDGPFASFMNSFNGMVFSVSLETGIPFYTVLLIFVLITWFAALALLRPQSAAVVLATGAFPSYVAMLSVVVISGGMQFIAGVHICGGVIVLLLIGLWRASKIDIVYSTRQTADGDFSTSLTTGKAARNRSRK